MSATFKAFSAEDNKAFTDAYGALAPSLESLEGWIKAGCANDVYLNQEKGATFNWANEDGTPNLELACPDLSKHNTYVTDVLKKNPELWDKLKGLTTPSGCSLGQCLKTGIDNPGHPMIKTVGLVACDDECYVTFADLFNPVIAGRHNGYDASKQVQKNDMDASKLHATNMDPSGKYILTTRCRTGRSVKGFKLPPAISFTERRALEAVCVEGLLSLDGELKGEYLPLSGSKSYAAMPNGMSAEQEEALRSSGNLFQEPDSTLLLSSGCGRHWPDARGIFANEARNFFVWINEEDQMRIVSMQKGPAVKEIFQRFADATAGVQKVLESKGMEFMRNENLGWILTCPSNLGTGLRAGTMMKVPIFSAHKGFKKFLAELKLQARGTAGVDSASTGGTWDISNADRLGYSEVELCNIFIEGAAWVIAMEAELEAAGVTPETVADHEDKIRKSLDAHLEKFKDMLGQNLLDA